MILSSLRINQLPADAWSWYRGYLEALDQLDVSRYGAYLADGVTIRFNNDPPTEGKVAVVAMLGGYWKSFAAVEHEPLNIYGDARHFVLEALNHYRRHDGRKVTVRAVAFTDRNATGEVTSVRVYADVSALFAA